ncbi:ABC transporter permease [Rhizobium paknamense]|uniref:ABC-type spermidine/putrescine transport system permease subunit I n=1 Tax=Rhizobium paknamense TaxID=1206817 RepID=A0ABU0IEW5_9HYPH|nr:ABC transporter permease subunit [Rhizobium paknamense]MDQ0456782.1 ABC-type spermidine/putrescine transport system permease subunit I [Rhizobium paknamense]
MAARNQSGRIDFLAYGFIAVPVMAIIVFLFYPAAMAIFGTLFHKRPEGSIGFDLSTYIFFFTDPYSLANLLRTLWTTAAALILIVAVNLPIALYMRFTRGWLAGLIQGLALFPMFVPGIIICYALIRYLGPNGWLQSLLSAVGFTHYASPITTPWGPVIGLIWDGMPMTLLILIAGLGTISDASIEAARDVGAGRLRILRSIILPQITHSILIVCALNFLGFFGQVLMPFMLGPTNPEMMGPFMLRTFVSVRDPLQAATQATITFLICSLAGLAYVRSLAARKEER